jgi:copper(I)-binding protein
VGPPQPGVWWAARVCAVSAGTRRQHRSIAVLLAVLTAVASLTGCAAGQRAQTATEISVVDGTSINIGSIELRNVGVAAPDPTAGQYDQGGSAQLVLAIVNAGAQDDQLTSVSTSAAQAVTSELAAQAAASAGADTSASSTESSSASSSPSGSSTPTTSSSSSAPASFVPIVCPAGKLVAVGYGETMQASITLQRLSQTLVSGQALAVTFTFKNAGTKTAQIPVKLGEGASSTPKVNISPSGE